MIKIDESQLTDFEREAALFLRDQRLADTPEAERPSVKDFLEGELNASMTAIGNLYEEASVPEMRPLGRLLLSRSKERRDYLIGLLMADDNSVPPAQQE
jgi:hypothetical protein